MELSEKRTALIDELIGLAFEKGYSEEDIELILMLTCVEEMVDTLGSSEEATRRAIEICKESDDAQECVAKVFDLMEK